MSDAEYLDLDPESLSSYYKLRAVVDTVAGMTDKYALSLYRQLSGQSL